MEKGQKKPKKGSPKGNKAKKKTTRPGSENLIPFDQRAEEEQRKIRSMGGKARWEKDRNDRMMIELTRKILDMPLSDSFKKQKGELRRYGIPEDEQSYAVSMLATIIAKAARGDVNAAKFVRDTAGLDPTTVLKEAQFEYMKENGQNINVNLDGELTTKSRVQIYLPERDEDPE